MNYVNQPGSTRSGIGEQSDVKGHRPKSKHTTRQKKKRAVLGQTRHDLQSPFSIPAKTPKKNGGKMKTGECA